LRCRAGVIGKNNRLRRITESGPLIRGNMMLEFPFPHRCSGSFNLRRLGFSSKSSRIPPAFPD
jgi:hypothetical protein